MLIGTIPEVSKRWTELQGGFRERPEQSVEQTTSGVLVIESE